jgi:hypothetical protein
MKESAARRIMDETRNHDPSSRARFGLYDGESYLPNRRLSVG